MDWEQLTPEQQALVKNLEDGFARPLAAKFTHDRNVYGPILAGWFSTTAAIVTGLDPATVIPLTSTLAGAQSLTAAQLTTLMGWIDQRQNDDYDAQLAVRAAGINANVGQ